MADVERIAAGRSASGLRDPAVLDAAQRCLPHLRQAAAELEGRRTLLRGAEPATGPETLLRSAGPVASTEPDQLVRPWDKDGAAGLGCSMEQAQEPAGGERKRS